MKQVKHISIKKDSKFDYYQGLLFNVVSGELVVSSPDEITRERLEAEATLLNSVERETECEAVTKREDTYEVIQKPLLTRFAGNINKL